MDILGDRVFRAAVLDLFAGTGALSLEALSRGATHAVLVEREPSVLRFLRKNIRKLRYEEQTIVLETDATLPEFSADIDWPFDLVFVDPPYADVEQPGGPERLARVVESLAATGRLSPDASVIVHLPPGVDPASIVPAGFELVDHRAYGRTEIVILDAPGPPIV